MSSSRSAYISIQELNETKKPGKLKARVSRLWEVLNPKDKDQLLCVDMVLIDEQGDYVHASIWSNCADAFRSKLKEGDIYIISNFSIESNKPNYKVVSHSEILIRFTYNTHIKAIEGEECIIPKHKFDFTPYGNLEQRRMKPIVLSDVYGVLKNEIFESNATTIELEDKSKNTIRVKLWGQFSTDYKQKKAELDDTSNLFIVVVTSTLVKGFTAANIRLDTSSSSQIYINLDIPEVNEFRGLLSGCNEEIIVGTSTIERDGELSISKKEITEILDHCKSPYEKVSYYHVEAKVNEVMSDLPWFYYFCPDCNKMLKPGLKTFKCDPKNCNKIIDNPYAGYRLELMVTDSSGSSTILTLFNDVAKKLINHEATTLRGIQVAQAESSEEHDRVPEIIRNELEGKTFTAMSSRCIRETIAEPASIGAFVMTRDIASIMDHCDHPYKEDFVCRCLATVTGIRAGLPWYNYECPDCGTRLNMESESFVCHSVGCNRVIVKPNILYRLELEVEDTTGPLALTVFNKQAQDMVMTDAEEMRARELSKGMLTEIGVAYQVPKEIREAFEGVAFVFTLKIDDFNHNSILSQSFNVEEIKDASELEGGHGREEHTLRRWGKRPWGLDGCKDEVQEGATSTNEHKHVRVSER